MEIEREQALGLWGVVVSIGAVAAIVSVLVISPMIDRWVRPRVDLSRGQAMLLLLGLSFLVGIAGGAVTYGVLHDHPDFQPDEQDAPPPVNRQVGSQTNLP